MGATDTQRVLDDRRREGVGAAPLQVVTLRLGEVRCALDIRCIEDADAPEKYAGGGVVDLRLWFGLPPTEDGDGGRRVVTVVSWGRRARFMVDAIDSVISLDRSGLRAPEHSEVACVSYTAEADGQTLHVLNADALVSRAGRTGEGCAKGQRGEGGGRCGCC